MHRYADGVRRGSAEAMAACFSDDASIEYGHGGTWHGREQILDYFSRALDRAARDTPLSLDDRRASTPVVSNLRIELDGDAARCESTVLAIHAGSSGEGESVVVRGTRNVDDVVRTTAGWRIRRRVHSTDWQFAVPADGEPQG